MSRLEAAHWCLALAVAASACGRIGFDQLPAQDGDGGDALDASVDASTSLWSASHQGWDSVRAVGARTPKQTAQALSMTPLRVEIAWKPMTIDPIESITAYEVHRSESPGGPYAMVGSAAPQDPGDTRFVDDTAIKEKTYYYLVRPLVGGDSLTPSGADAELQVMTPPDNMALVHRWMANQEVCGLLHASDAMASDHSENYRCPYTGPGRIGYAGDIGDPPAAQAFYDLGAHFFVDAVETGCDYTLSSAGCLAATGVPGPCLGNGNAAPDAVANEKGGIAQFGLEGDVFYDRGSSLCYRKGGSNWTATQASTAEARGLMASNSPGLPPLVMIDQLQSSAVCQRRSYDGTAMQLPSRKLQVAVSAWPARLSVQQIHDIESGTGASDCNSDLGHAGEIVFDDTIEPTDYASLPGTTANGFRVLRSGASVTASCTSRYGIQDLAGNVWEWASDQFVASSAGTIYTGAVSNLDPGNKDVADIIVAKSFGGGGGEWPLSAAPGVLPVLGLPAASDAPAWYGSLATSAFELFGDRLFFDVDTDEVRSTYYGGSASSDDSAGRFAINISRPPTHEHQRIGFRCAVKLSP